MKRSVGLIIFTRIKGTDGKESLTAILQKRGTYNFEEMRPESYPGCHQVTAHGGLKENEGFNDALFREVNEELGMGFNDRIVDYLRQETSIQMTDEKHAITYAVLVPFSVIREVRLEPGTGGLELLTVDRFNSDPPIAITKDMKQNGPPNGKIALFPDEIEAVANGFAMFASV